jgi:two-component system phosphate regulon response regulator PhoB/two-component system alkaline phosphatase synthesis response regulator PhoP
MKNILIVEDDNFMEKSLSFTLKDEGYKIDTAVDGEEALDKASKLNLDLILLDIILPKIDGFEVLEKIKENPKTKDIPVLILSNLGQKDDVEKGLKLGATGYIIKAHFKLEDVVNKIKEILK